MSRRRIVKKRGVLPSFGDMILPVVGVAAVGLLVIAGRQFFLNGFKTSPGISSTRAYAEAPALIAERENKIESEAILPPVVKIEEENKDSSFDAALKLEEKKEADEFLAIAVATQQNSVPQTKWQPAKTQTSTTTKTTPKRTTAASTSNAVSKKTTAKASNAKSISVPTSKNSSFSQQWRVQIGAYTSKAGAQEAANKIKKSGYKAIVYQNPASKHFKVWVQGGADKKSAERVAEAMKKLGYKGSFTFPPAK